MSSYVVGLTLGVAIAQAQRVAEVAKAEIKAEMKHVRAMPADQQAEYWAQKEKQAEIDRQEGAVRALELARQGRYPPPAASGGLGFVFGVAIGSTL